MKKNNLGFIPLETRKTAGKNKQNKPLAGFTIIELLVVIAIIGVLAAIVLINVTRYIDKGKDAAAKGDMATLLTNAITFYNEKNSFENIKTDDDYKNPIQSMVSNGYTITDTCNDSGSTCTSSSAQKWCASVQLKSVSGTVHYCVDSSGTKKETATPCAAGVCP
jgi:prepilin-type N-terminal cleavage/methylation domain-containing protein